MKAARLILLALVVGLVGSAAAATSDQPQSTYKKAAIQPNVNIIKLLSVPPLQHEPELKLRGDLELSSPLLNLLAAPRRALRSAKAAATMLVTPSNPASPVEILAPLNDARYSRSHFVIVRLSW